jgi:hypothetical protein
MYYFPNVSVLTSNSFYLRRVIYKLPALKTNATNPFASGFRYAYMDANSNSNLVVRFQYLSQKNVSTKYCTGP